uniref:Uncharacterized protein n=1 Tax=Anguilla anguilla TaxID=7936 RepID=A0A0E9TSL9_ANGAN
MSNHGHIATLFGRVQTSTCYPLKLAMSGTT